MTRSPPKEPLIAIIGATGTGKSQLAVELAKRYDGEIINADAIQLYAGLPIITNKITREEQQGIPHHLLGRISLDDPTWVVGSFVQKALRVIEEIRSRGRLPILVGGTHYYTQSLLFKDRLTEEQGCEDEQKSVEDTKQEWPILEQPTHVLLDELRRVDPIMADRWHPNDHRKIQRSLEIYLRTGRKASDIYAEQRAFKSPQHLRLRNNTSQFLQGSDMRFPTLLFWVHADSDTLRDRLDRRVDKMVKQGLLDEVRTLNAVEVGRASSGKPVDETRGIWVSIGYKEFKSYVHAIDEGAATSDEMARLQAEALEKTKAATRQYAKRQLQWIRIKLINALIAAKASKSLYLLDGSDVSSFDRSVVDPAAKLTHDFLTTNNPMPEPTSISHVASEMLTARRNYDLAATPKKWFRQHCEHCGITCVTEEQWIMHVKSKGHRKKALPNNCATKVPEESTEKQRKPQCSTNGSGGELDKTVVLSEVALGDCDLWR